MKKTDVLSALLAALTLALSLGFAQAAPPTTTPKENPTKAEEPAVSPSKNLQIRWYGHAFIYITSSKGVRVAIDPFGEETVQNPFPEELQADFVLISNEGQAHAAAERLLGTAQTFRSTVAVGLNRANGLVFRGTATRLAGEEQAPNYQNTVFSFTLDGIRFVHLGWIGQKLTSRQIREIGPVDVVFLPVGYRELSAQDLSQMAKDLQAKIVIPMAYKTPLSGEMDLRELEAFTTLQPFVEPKESSQIEILVASLPTKPTVYVLKTPS